jgi:Cys-tRNA(Pro)/Cys-tRNA(Cys) deacylase
MDCLNKQMDNVVTPAIQYLRDRQIPHRVFIHENPIESLEQAAAERNERPEQVVRSIVFRLSESEHLMVLMSGPTRVPWKALRQYLGISRMTMASEEEVLDAAGCRPGTVSPFALPEPMQVLVDQSILGLPEVSLGACQRGIAIILKPSDLIKALDNPRVVDFSAL